MSHAAKCLSTRPGLHGLPRRRYVRADGTRYTTVELPLTVLRGLGAGEKLAWLLARFERGERARAVADRRRREVAARAGWKATAVAHDLGITEARVRQIRAELARG